MKFDDEQARYLAKFIAKNMIARTDVKASQLPRGQGAYVRDDSKWTMTDLMAHVKGEQTYGHYLLDQDSNVKIIAFDIDLAQTGHYLPYSLRDQERYADEEQDLHIGDPGLMGDEYFIECNPREAWVDRKHPARPWLKHQMRELAERFTAECFYAGLGTFATYSGNKGIHVYGLLGERTPAADARILAFAIAEKVVRNLEINSDVHGRDYRFASSKGKSFYYIKSDTAPLYRSFENFSIEVFPKQDHIEPNRLGNLMRLPFGKNLKNPKDPTFVIDQLAPSSSLVPLDDFKDLQFRVCYHRHPFDGLYKVMPSYIGDDSTMLNIDA